MRTVFSFTAALILLNLVVHAPPTFSKERLSDEKVCEEMREFAASSGHEAEKDNAFYSYATANADCDTRTYAMTVEVRPAVLIDLEGVTRTLVKAVCAIGWAKVFDYGWQTDIILEFEGKVVGPVINVRAGDC